jgi:hypothetical protein
MILKMFHRPKPRQFNYKPVFYNPENEQKQQRKQESDDFRSKFRAETSRSSKFSSGRKNISIGVYLVIIALLIYLIFFS